jgi:hypothetical protein
MCRVEVKNGNVAFCFAQNMVQNNPKLVTESWQDALSKRVVTLSQIWCRCIRPLSLVIQIQSIHNVVTTFEPSQLVLRKFDQLAIMPPKKRRRTDTPQSSPSAEPTTPDLHSWPGWCEIESEPVCDNLVFRSSPYDLHTRRPSSQLSSKTLVFAI